MGDCLRGGRWRCVQGLAKLPNPSWSHLLVAPWAYPLYVSREWSSPDRQAASVLLTKVFSRPVFIVPYVTFRLYFIIPWHNPGTIDLHASNKTGLVGLPSAGRAFNLLPSKAPNAFHQADLSCVLLEVYRSHFAFHPR